MLLAAGLVEKVRFVEAGDRLALELPIIAGNELLSFDDNRGG
jgi:hypothetical protein